MMSQRSFEGASVSVDGQKMGECQTVTVSRVDDERSPLPSFPKSFSGSFSFMTSDDRRRMEEDARNFRRFGTYHPTHAQRQQYAKSKKKSRHKRR